MNLTEVLAIINAFPTYASMRRMAHQGGIKVNGKVVDDTHAIAFIEGTHEISVGKVRVYAVTFSEGDIQQKTLTKRKAKTEEVTE